MNRRVNPPQVQEVCRKRKKVGSLWEMGTPSVFSCLYVTEAVLLAFPRLSKDHAGKLDIQEVLAGKRRGGGSNGPRLTEQGEVYATCPSPVCSYSLREREVRKQE